jgi:hypothetical protein
MAGYPEWNSDHPAQYREIPLKRIRALLKQGHKAEAIQLYCHETGAGRVEAEASVTQIEHGEGDTLPYRYTGWRTGGVPRFWCATCQRLYRRGQVQEHWPEGNWGKYHAYLCSLCHEETAEVHQGQAWKAAEELLRGAVGEVAQRYRHAFQRANVAFQNEQMDEVVALAYEAALVNGERLEVFLQGQDYLAPI